MKWGTIEVSVSDQNLEALEVRQGSGEDASWWTVVRIATNSALPSLDILARDAADRGFGEGLGRTGFDARFEATSADGKLSSVPEHVQENALRLPATLQELHMRDREVVLVHGGSIDTQAIRQALEFAATIDR